MFLGILHPNAEFGKQIQTFFSVAVIACAAVGGVTANPRILLIQGGPAILSFAALALGY